jgi:hypothetical protein
MKRLMQAIATIRSTSRASRDSRTVAPPTLVREMSERAGKPTQGPSVAEMRGGAATPEPSLMKEKKKAVMSAPVLVPLGGGRGHYRPDSPYQNSPVPVTMTTMPNAAPHASK